MKTQLCELLGIAYPVVQAPMVWITGTELVAAVSNAGGLGVIKPNPAADAVEAAERLRHEIKTVKSLTNKPFGVNLVIPLADYPRGGKALSDRCLQVILEEGIAAAVLTGGEPEMYTKQLKDAQVKVLHRPLPVNVEVARKAEAAGVDALIAVGFEGGGHVGHDRIPTFVLIPSIVNAVELPVIAGGGIVDGRGLVAALALGAEGIFMGTRFIATRECLAHDAFKRAILNATDTSTTTCTGRIGVLRALKNPLMERCIQMEVAGSAPLEIANVYAPAFPKGMLDGDLTWGTLGCGAGAGLIKEMKSAAEVVHDTVTEARQILSELMEVFRIEGARSVDA